MISAFRASRFPKKSESPRERELGARRCIRACYFSSGARQLCGAPVSSAACCQCSARCSPVSTSQNNHHQTTTNHSQTTTTKQPPTTTEQPPAKQPPPKRTTTKTTTTKQPPQNKNHQTTTTTTTKTTKTDGPIQDRTGDLQIFSLTLSQLSYWPAV